MLSSMLVPSILTLEAFITYSPFDSMAGIESLVLVPEPVTLPPPARNFISPPFAAKTSPRGLLPKVGGLSTRDLLAQSPSFNLPSNPPIIGNSCVKNPKNPPLFFGALITFL